LQERGSPPLTGTNAPPKGIDCVMKLFARNLGYPPLVTAASFKGS
jgi:hypothetical protein